MRRLAKFNPETYTQYLLIMEAEWLRLKGLTEKAAIQLDTAFSEVERTGHLYLQALVPELQARLYFTQGRIKLAEFFLRQSYQGYARWSAEGKMSHMRESYPRLLEGIDDRMNEETTTTYVGTTTTRLQTPEITSMWRVSRLFRVGKTTETHLAGLVRLIAEVSGAQSAAVVIAHQGNLLVQAALLPEQEIKVLQDQPVEEATGLSESVIRYVMRTGKDMILFNAYQESFALSDPYLTENRVRSVLCTPIEYKSIRTGVLYLENRLSAGSFGPERLQILHVLLAQISLLLEIVRPSGKSPEPIDE